MTEIRPLPQLKNKAGPTKKRKLDYAKILTSILEKQKILDLVASKIIGQRIKEKVKKAAPKKKKQLKRPLMILNWNQWNPTQIWTLKRKFKRRNQSQIRS